MCCAADNHNYMCHTCAKEFLDSKLNKAVIDNISNFHKIGPDSTYRIVSNKRPGGIAILQKGDVYKRQVFNAKMQCLSLFTMTRC